MSHTPVFYDPHGTRSRWVRRLGAGLGVLAAVVSTAFVLTLFAAPLIPRLPGLRTHLRPLTRRLLPAFPSAETARLQFAAAKAQRSLFAEIARRKKAVQPRSTGRSPGIVAAFYAPWQETGLYSLRAHAAQLTHVLPEWLHLRRDPGLFDDNDWNPSGSPHNLDVVQIARANGVAILPILNNAENGNFDGRRVSGLLASPNAQARLAESLRDWILQHGFQGVNIDFESLARADYLKLPAFLRTLRSVFAPHGLLVTADLEAGGAAPLREVCEPCDFVVLMAYDQHSEDGSAGPIAAIDWSDEILQRVAKAVPPDKLVVGLGSYAYDWKDGHGPAESLTYQEALTTAAGYRDQERPRDVIALDPDSLNMHFDYEDDTGANHSVWMLDAVSAFNQWADAQDYGVRGAALWVLGSEDPSVWSFLDRHRTEEPPNPTGLARVRFPYDIDFQGKGEILWFKAMPTEGERRVRFSADSGLIEGAHYESYPSSYVIERKGYSPKKLALTFDDGPDPVYTPQILDVLKELRLPAAFFVIGESAEKSPYLVRRMVDEGHEVGSHTFTHPNLGAVSDRRIELELNTTQRALQSIIGRQTVLFRPPYNADAEPSSAEEVRPLVVADRLHYITVGEFVDPQDWNPTETSKDGTRRPRTAQDIASSILQQVATGEGNVILLHDGGGDRSATIEALRIVVPTLRAKGYKFVSVSDLAGFTRDQVMPPLNGREKVLVGLDRAVFWTLFTVEALLALGFFAAIVLGLARIGFIIPLAIVHHLRQPNAAQVPGYKPDVSVLVAAYNEESVIVRTVESVLASGYPGLEVVVVDDGSADNTSAAVAGAFGNDPRVRLVRQDNAGKAAALNRAIAEAHGEILVCIDADTQVDSAAVGRLAQHFRDGRVGAVAGNVKVGNPNNLLSRWQAIEYTASQNLDRRAYAVLNAITVVPGAIGAWRRTAVEAVGGYQSDTLAEDTDLTWRLREAGWRLETASLAKAYTEVPDSYRAFARQRFRWSFGTLQCLWKHRRALFRFGWFGRLALPAMWIFNIAFQGLAPLVDLQILFTLAAYAVAWAGSGAYDKDWQPLAAASHQLWQVGFLYGLFFVVELAGAWIAFSLDREKKGPLWWLFLQRVVYRQVMYGVLYRSLVRAVSGSRQGWGKLARKASVSLPGP